MLAPHTRASACPGNKSDVKLALARACRLSGLFEYLRGLWKSYRLTDKEICTLSNFILMAGGSLG